MWFNSVSAYRLPAREIMFARMISERRLLGFDRGDWSMLLGGLVLAGFLAALLA
jgi:hypothetical protein